LIVVPPALAAFAGAVASVRRAPSAG